MLDSFNSAGMRVVEFPDNSIVCHAHRETGAYQDVFVTGSALAVHATRAAGFFPNVYNEDWLFFYQDAAHAQLGASGLPATQLVYDPFREPARAAWQEFGDVLAEGLYGLLHQGKGAEHATSEYWAEFLRQRQNFLLAIIDRAGLAEAGMQESIRTAVQEAVKCSAAIEAGEYECYVGLWQADLRNWKQRIVGLPAGLSLGKALKDLDLASSAEGGGRPGGPFRSGASGYGRPGRDPSAHLPALNGAGTTAAELPARAEAVAARLDDTLPMLAIDFGPYIPDPGRQVELSADPLRSLGAQWRRALRSARSTAAPLVRPTGR
jgi:hypothetical protein